MSINLISPTCFTTAVLIGDSSSTGNPPSITVANNLPVAVALELQSTTGALLLPRMTTDQRNELTNSVEGMQIYNSTTKSVEFYQPLDGAGGEWTNNIDPASSKVKYAKRVLNRAEIFAMNGNPIVIVPAPVNGSANILLSATLVHNYVGAAFTAGGDIKIQNGVQANAAGETALIASFPVELLTANNQSQFYSLGPYQDGDAAGLKRLGDYTDTAISISNGGGAAFATGDAASTLSVYLTYINV